MLLQVDDIASARESPRLELADERCHPIGDDAEPPGAATAMAEASALEGDLDGVVGARFTSTIGTWRRALDASGRGSIGDEVARTSAESRAATPGVVSSPVSPANIVEEFGCLTTGPESRPFSNDAIASNAHGGEHPAMQARLSAAPTMPPERWAAMHGVAALAEHLAKKVPPASPSHEAGVALTRLLNDPALRAYESLRADWHLDKNPPHQPASAIVDLPAYDSHALWAARYLRMEIEAMLEPLAASVPAGWVARATSVLDLPSLLDHARRSLLTAEEQVAVADELGPERQRADPSDELRAKDMRAMATTAEEWVARHAHTLLLGYMFGLRYSDPLTDRWMARVYALNRSPEASSHYREQLLTPAEWAAIEAHVHSDSYEL